MARVFVSYRRADGRVVVDWLAERLEKLDSINGVQTAFHDGGLRAGDDFPTALEEELAGSDLLVAVIGPEWQGRSEDGSGASRIKDEDDWVVREIATAFRLDTVVIPVLLETTPHPLASDLHPSIADMSSLHTLPMTCAEDLDTIVEHIEDHLAEQDRARAKLAGLEEPVVVPELTKPRKLVTLCVAGGLVGLVLAWLTGWVGLGDSEGRVQSGPGWDWFRPLLLLNGLFLGAIIPAGYLFSRRIWRTSVVQWAALAGGVATVGAIPLLLSATDDNSMKLLTEDGSITMAAPRSYGAIAMIAVAVGAWVIAIGAPVYTRPAAEDHELGKRVTNLAILRDAERWGMLMIALVVAMSTALNVALAAAAAERVDDNGVKGGVEGFDFDELSLIAIPLVLAAVVVIVHRWAVTRLADAHISVVSELEGLPPRYQANATPRLAAAPFADGGWGFRLALATPVMVAICGVLIYTIWG